MTADALPPAPAFDPEPAYRVIRHALWDLDAGRSRAARALALMDVPTIGDPLTLWTVGVRDIRAARQTLRARGVKPPSRWVRLSDGRRIAR